ncbi:hypothetical protein V496_02909 [Pseudogymnoascus sp. VKM F-4515 (FW-2607)]|nr:hypothetical protein V496_02909 [Pseudogymnoascus sp. VKM F-4515 (FW-2607)]
MEATSALDRASSLLAKSSSAPESSTFTAATNTSTTLSSAAVVCIVLGSVASAAVIGALIYLCGRTHIIASFIRYSSPQQGKAPPIKNPPYDYDLPSAHSQKRQPTSPILPNPTKWISSQIKPITPAAATSQPGYRNYRNNELVSPLSPVLIQSSPSEPPWNPYPTPYVRGHDNGDDERNFVRQAVELDAGTAKMVPPKYF